MGGGAVSRRGGVLPRLRSVLLDLRRSLERSLGRSLERESELLRRLRRLPRDSVPKGGINAQGYICPTRPLPLCHRFPCSCTKYTGDSRPSLKFWAKRSQRFQSTCCNEHPCAYNRHSAVQSLPFLVATRHVFRMALLSQPSWVIVIS